MPAGVYNFPLSQGETFYYKVQLLGRTEPEVLDLTGFTPQMQIRRTTDSSEIIATPQIIISDAINGIIDIYLSAEETAKLPCNGQNKDDLLRLVYDIYVSAKSSDTRIYKTRILNGYIYVSPQTTK